MSAVARFARFSGTLLLLVGGCAALGSPPQSASPSPASREQITILYDAFGKAGPMQKDWGYAALVEYGGKRILFDTGNNPDIFAQNAKSKRVDLSKLDFVVMSHRHGDNMGGLAYLLRVNLYSPKQGVCVYGADLPGTFYRRDAALPVEQRYYGGAPPEILRFGSAWPAANFQLIDNSAEVVPGFHLITLVSTQPGTLELRELSLAIQTPYGVVLVVGCSHPGIERIVEAATSIDRRIHLIAGGLHLVVSSDPDIEKVVTALQDKFKVDYIAPGHCTGEPAFAALKKAFGDRYLFAGLGDSIHLTGSPNRIP